MKKYRPVHDGAGNRSGRDKHGRVYWIDQGGRRTSYGAPQKAAQPRDEYGRVESATSAKHTRLEPYRNESGQFERHPAKVAADNLRDGVIGKDEFQDLADDFDLDPREIWDIYDQVYG